MTPTQAAILAVKTLGADAPVADLIDLAFDHNPWPEGTEACLEWFERTDKEVCKRLA